MAPDNSYRAKMQTSKSSSSPQAINRHQKDDRSELPPQLPHTSSSTSTRNRKLSQLSDSSSPEQIQEFSNLDVSPSAKRRKLDAQHSATALDPPRTTAENMYNFSTPGSSLNGAIDLTQSPSPGRRRLSSVSKVDTSGYTGAKKLVVKNFRTSSKSNPEQYCEKTTAQLQDALTHIFMGTPQTLSNEELYRGAENVCKMGKGAALAAILGAKCEQHVSRDLKQPLLALSQGDPIDLLQAVVGAWSRWTGQVIMMRKIFLYLDRAYLLQQHLPSIQETAVSHFRQHIFHDETLQTPVVDGALALLRKLRTDDDPNHTLFRAAIKMFHELQVYTSDVEPRLLAVSQDYIQDWADRTIANVDLVQYLDQAYSLMDQEVSRCDEFALDPSTKRDLLSVLDNQLVERRVSVLTSQDNVADLLDANDVEHLKSLYSLLKRKRLADELYKSFEKWIDDEGTSIIFDEKAADSMVVRLLQLKQKLDHILVHAFERSDKLGLTLRDAFANFINKTKKTSATAGTDNSKPGEMIAKYIDMLLRSGAKAIPAAVAAKKQDEDEEMIDADKEAQVNDQLNQVLDLFRFLEGKAVFEAFYKKDLARRLLLGRSADADAERHMLARLKDECGAGFTQNLEQMFKDVELARDEVAFFKQRMEASEVRSPLDLDVNVLSASAWPTYPDVPVVIPPEVTRTLEKFESVYQMKHTGRKLQWKHSLAHSIVRASFNKSKKELVVSSFQAVILLMFNKVAPGQKLSYERIKAESGLPEVDAKRTLQSLACAKIRPLTKHPKGKDIANTDEFSVNEDFLHERFRVKINQLQAKETKEENTATHEQVAADRKFETQAAIVRIMKSRKTISHQALIVETINATKSRGTLQPGEIKKQIESLIDKEYMERDGPSTYTYLA